MRAVIVDDANKAKATSLSIGEIDRPEVKDPKHALVGVKAFGLNRMDIMQRQGLYPVPPQAPATLGVEFSGIIEEAGNSSGWKKGDEVFGLAYGGAYAEYVLVDGGMLTNKPRDLSWEQAAAIPEAWLTAFQALFLIAEMKEGARVLIHAGASGVGIAAIQLAKGFGAKQVFTTAGTQEKLDFLTKKLGADHGINYKSQKFSDEVLKLTDNQGVDVIIDFVGQDYFEMNLKSAARDAHMVMLGLLSGGKVEGGLDLSTILYKRMRIEGTTLRSRSTEYQVNLLQRFSREAMPKVLQGHYELVLHKVLPWNEIVQATQILEDSGNIGKVVCTI